jgi:hypothetical protein
MTNPLYEVMYGCVIVHRIHPLFAETLVIIRLTFNILKINALPPFPFLLVHVGSSRALVLARL